MLKVALDAFHPIDRVRDALDAAGCEPRGAHVIRSRCPAHRGGSRDSLKVSRGEDWPVVVVCFAGCATADILEALGLPWKALLDER